MGGNSATNEAGIYGTLGVAAAANLPGSRLGAASWTDSSGNLWMFGGSALDAAGVLGLMNDLWVYKPSTKQWTWMGGSNAFGANCFLAGGNDCSPPGIYGTLGTASSANIPPGRTGASTWTDAAGNFWLFGGWGYDVTNQTEYFYNDLWKFSPASNQWAWMGGSSSKSGSSCFNNNLWYYLGCGEPGVYGMLTTPAAANMPGGREGGAAWVDNNGNFWLFGGQGFDSNGVFSDLNDMWEYNPATNKWAWMTGPNVVYGYYTTPTGVFGTLGTPSAATIPLTRFDAASWKDSLGNLWLFGGWQNGWYSNSFDDVLNDLWEFTPSTNQWAWMGGTNGTYPSSTTPVYGSLGVAAAGNDPGGRSGMPYWTDSTGNFWLFGGEEASFNNGNDLWEFQPAATSLPTAATPVFSVPAGTYSGDQTVTISDATNGSTVYYTIDGTTPTTSSLVYFGPVTVAYSQTLQAIATASGCLQSAVASAVYTLPPQAATPVISPASGTYTTDLLITITDATPGTSIYYSSGSVRPLTPANSTLYTGPFTILGSQSVFAIAVASGHSNSFAAEADYTLNLPMTANPTFTPGTGSYPTTQTVTISDATPGAIIYVSIGGTAVGPITSWPLYTGPITVSSTESISAIARAPNAYQSDEVDALITIAPAAATPTFSLPTGTYTSPQTVSIADTTSGAVIYYTTNGTVPTTFSSVYTGPITVSATETLEAIAVAYGFSNSSIASATYTIPLPTAATPTFSLPAGNYSAAQTVSISDTTAGAKLYYTTNGTVPTTASTVYTAPITVTSSETLEAIAVAANYGNSAVASAAYTITLPPPAAATPVFSPSSGAFNAAQTISISDATPGAAIFYTTNGTTPTSNSTVYSGPITVSTTETLEAIATAANYSNSSVATASYSITIPAPDFSIAASPASMSLVPGQSGNSNLNITALNGFNAPISFSCSGLPLGAACSFAPATVNPASATASTVLTLSTTLATPAIRARSASVLPGIAAALVLLFFRRKKQRFQLLAVWLCLAQLTLLGGCGSGGSSGTTPAPAPINSTIVVTATSAQAQHTVSIFLTME